MCLKDVILYTLKNEVVPAMGCTEPVAVALACAKAKQLLDSELIEAADILVSPNIYKNGLGVGVPNTDEVGLDIAAALGLTGCCPEKSLRLLEDVTPDQLEKAHELLAAGKIRLSVKDTEEKVYVEVKIKAGTNNVKIIISGKHNNIAYIEKNNSVMLKKNAEKASIESGSDILYNSTIADIINVIEKMKYEELDFLMEGIAMNERIAMTALEKKLGLGVGYGIKKYIENGILGDDLMNNAMMYTAAAADARMAGINMPVMSSNGSGNNGLTAILPIAVYRKKHGTSDEKTVKALAISHILNCYIKKQIGRLSALCGCAVAAATGASAAITWLMDGSNEKIEGAIKNMIANISGMICDGAKGSCALKVSSAASVAVQSAMLAMNECITSSKNGIIAESAEETIRNLGILSRYGMNETDRVILDIMKDMVQSI
ncbi:MAG: serine dehydratase subunit alpha family protein [Bacillota bacterium]